MKKWYHLGPFTIFDLETTGLSPSYHRIVEIAAIRINIDGSEKKFHFLVNPQCHIPNAVTKIHGITNEMVSKQPAFDVVGSDFLNFSEGSTLVAHNAKFDLSFLQESLHRHSLCTWKGKTVDSIAVIKQVFPNLKSYSLDKLRVSFGLVGKHGPSHRAYADVETTLELFKHALEKLSCV